MEIIGQILRQSFLMFLWVGSFVGVVVGLALWLKPQQVNQMNQYFSRWVGSEKMELALDRPRWIERFFYRHHKLVGAGLLIGAAAVLYTFLFSYNLRTISALVPRGYWWIVDALVGMLLLGTALAALIGILVLARPSLLRELEKASNHWVSTERFQTMFNGMHLAAEQTMLRHHRVAGALILLGSIYILIILGYFLFQGQMKW